MIIINTPLRMVPVMIYWGTPYFEQFSPTYVIKIQPKRHLLNILFYGLSANFFKSMNISSVFHKSYSFYLVTALQKVSIFYLCCILILSFKKYTWHPYIHTMHKYCAIRKNKKKLLIMMMLMLSQKTCQKLKWKRKVIHHQNINR